MRLSFSHTIYGQGYCFTHITQDVWRDSAKAVAGIGNRLYTGANPVRTQEGVFEMGRLFSRSLLILVVAMNLQSGVAQAGQMETAIQKVTQIYGRSQTVGEFLKNMKGHMPAQDWAFLNEKSKGMTERALPPYIVSGRKIIFNGEHLTTLEFTNIKKGTYTLNGQTFTCSRTMPLAACFNEIEKPKKEAYISLFPQAEAQLATGLVILVIIGIIVGVSHAYNSVTTNPCQDQVLFFHKILQDMHATLVHICESESESTNMKIEIRTKDRKLHVITAIEGGFEDQIYNPASSEVGTGYSKEPSSDQQYFFTEDRLTKVEDSNSKTILSTANPNDSDELAKLEKEYKGPYNMITYGNEQYSCGKCYDGIEKDLKGRDFSKRTGTEGDAGQR